MSDSEPEFRAEFRCIPSVSSFSLILLTMIFVDSDELPDEGQHNAPFDATDVLSVLESVNALDQCLVEAAIYDHEQLRTLGLDILCRLWIDRNSRGAMRLLSRHHHLDIEPHQRVDIEDPDIAVGVGPHYLNYTMYVGARLGLNALLPNLNFSMIQCLWLDSKATCLLFNNSGRMMYIGRRLQEYAWIAMMPNEWLVPDHPINATGAWPHLNVPTSVMTTKHALMLVMFMAHAFSILRFRDFSCRVMYPEPLTHQKVNSATDIL
ncbi:hypothetical protein J3R83DRAFT_11669 [Lanmaoa asiatica]|nr:hypothetical protein J3R83DRAFT_11669 [Lanmaoa asiatica]